MQLLMDELDGAKTLPYFFFKHGFIKYTEENTIYIQLKMAEFDGAKKLPTFLKTWVH